MYLIHKDNEGRETLVAVVGSVKRSQIIVDLLNADLDDRGVDDNERYRLEEQASSVLGGGPKKKDDKRDLSDQNCYEKAQRRHDVTFTVVGQDETSAAVVCFWIMKNIKTCPEDKLHEALNRAIQMRDIAKLGGAKAAD